MSNEKKGPWLFCWRYRWWKNYPVKWELFHFNREIRIPSLSNQYLMESKSQVIQAVTFHSLFGGHLTIEKGHVNSPSQKGHQQNCQEVFFFCGTCDVSSFFFSAATQVTAHFAKFGQAICGGGLSMMLRFSSWVSKESWNATHFGMDQTMQIYGNLQLWW